MRTLCALAIFAAAGITASGQVTSNQSLNGKYYFRQVLLITDGTSNVVETRSAFGTLTFDGNGNSTVNGQQIVNALPAAALNGLGTYTVQSTGLATFSDPLLAGKIMNARLGATALVASSTEAGSTIFDLLIAIPAPAKALGNTTLSGFYHVSSLEFPNGGLANIRDANFRLTANGAGSFAETTVTGQAANLANKLTTQTVSPMTYSISPDGTGMLNFPAAAGLDTTTQVIAGVKNIYVSNDGSYFIGGSTSTGGHGIVVGVQAFSGTATNASWTGFYFAAGMRYDVQLARLAAVVGSVNANADGNSIWARRTHQSDGLFDAAPLLTYKLSGDGSGVFTSTSGHVNLASNAATFATSGVDVLSSNAYEIYFGTILQPRSGTGVFIDPDRVLNSASYAPIGYPLSPGGLVTLFGTGFGTTSASVPANISFPPILAGVQVTVNGIPAPIYSVSANPAQISAVVPFGATGSTATVVATVNGTKSNSVEVPLAATAPGIFSLTQNGIGDGAILHLDYSKVTAANPARPGDFVQVYLTGLGAVSPPVADGALAPAKPTAQVIGPVNVYVGGILMTNIQYKGLAPTLGGLYQLNIQLPANIAPGTQSLAIQTADGYTDLVNIAIASPSP